ncbi:hypothetical protein [Sporomusa carbonis]|uniref:hypothetical protein n=1 Tax=Sporomusa carbonis TaxID=3076075 RepID=UPI003C7C4B93
MLLASHPLAWTPVCTDQMRALENNWQTFQKLSYLERFIAKFFIRRHRIRIS